MKTKFVGHINNVRVPFLVDVGIDDVKVPGAEIREIATRLEGFEAPEIYTYSLESTIAEKFDAILQRMETTSRMKDFFDIYYLSNVFNFDGGLLRDAVTETARHRGRELEEDVFARIEKFDESEFFRVQWSKFEPAEEIHLSFSDGFYCSGCTSHGRWSGKFHDLPFLTGVCNNRVPSRFLTIHRDRSADETAAGGLYLRKIFELRACQMASLLLS